MKVITKVLIILSVICLPWGVSAHQPDLSSTILVEQDNNEWVLQIRAALTAFEYVVESRFGASSYASPEEFQDLVVDYLSENISVQFNGDHSALLEKGTVKLGHETIVTFHVEGTSEALQSLMVKNASFSDISRNQSALLLLKKGFEKEQFILSNDNGHIAELEVNDAKFVLVSPQEDSAVLFPFLMFGAAILVILVIYFIVRNNPSFSGDSPLQKDSGKIKQLTSMLGLIFYWVPFL